MEISQPKVPVLFSEMLQMFPNIPHDIIWMYVQRYSPDIEMCAQMLNQHNAKYSVLDPLSAMDNAKDLNDLNFFIQPSHIISSPQILLDNNNEIELLNKSPMKNNETGVSIKANDSNNHQTEYFPANPSELNSSANVYPNAYKNAIPLDIPENSNISCHFETLELHINVDNDDDDSGVHSWRPNYSSDVLCSDFFLPSPIQENFSLSSSLFSNSNDQHSVSNVQINSNIGKQNSSFFSPISLKVYDDCLQAGRAYIIDIASHLRHQKSKMNAIRYEFIKAKIELSELKEAEEKLQLELKEKMQTKSVQDIETLNSEIVQLRLECQCLCTEVDSSLNDQVLLGEIDERCYQRSNSSPCTEDQNPVNDSSTQTQSNNTTRVHDEINKWECSKCTFANHPEIKVCEMCHVPKPSTCDPLYRNGAPTCCFCHPKKDSLSVQS